MNDHRRQNCDRWINGRYAFLVLCAALSVKLSACGANEQRTITTNVVGSVTSEESFKEIAIGGICRPPAGKTLNDGACQDLGDFTRDGIDLYLPSSVQIEHIINLAASGGGYVYRLRWKYKEPKAFERSQARVDWKVYQDESGTLKPTISSWNEFLDKLQPQYLAPDNHNEFVTQKLLPGRKYVYYLTSSVFGIKDKEQIGVNAEVVFFRVVVDLTKAVLSR